MTRYLADGVTPISDIIGEDLGYCDVETSMVAGFSLNPKKLLRQARHTVEKVTRPVTSTINKIPGVKDALAAEREYAAMVTTPFRVGGGFITGAIQGGSLNAGLKGAKTAATATLREGKRFVQNPVVRYGTKGAALAFPALAPVAAGVEAANQVIAAVNHQDPIKAAFALATVANTAIAANGGDEDAMRAIRTIKAVKDGTIPPELGKVASNMKLPSLGARFTIPQGATKTAIKMAASNLLAKANAGNSTAMSVVRQTVAAAKAGDADAHKAATVLAAVHKFKPSKPSMRKPGRLVKGLARKAPRAGKGKSFTGAYIVDSKGHVSKGNFTAK